MLHISKNITTVNLTKTADTVVEINGTITGPEGTYAALIETDGNYWEVLTTRVLDSNNFFDFGEVAKPSTNKAYYVVGAIEKGF